jgi:winged helix Storkhead-box1 protein
MQALKDCFPSMNPPPRELVYHTLETLIRERKVYQTPHGYFVVTPSTLRYMAHQNQNQHQQEWNHEEEVEYPMLKRHNSLKTFRQRDIVVSFWRKWSVSMLQIYKELTYIYV